MELSQPQYHLAGVVHEREDRLADFDGPLDLILTLLSKNKIEIQDISIYSILEQYLAYLEECRRMDMEIASEFISMASRLMLIKTKMLLSVAEREEAEQEMQELIHSLEDRQRQEALAQIRHACEFLDARGDAGRGSFPHAPEPLPQVQGYRYQHAPGDLLAAFAAMEDRAQRALPPPAAAFSGILTKEPYPVPRKAAQILHRLLSGAALRLRELFRGALSRSELVATFMAVLELCSTHEIELSEDRGGLLLRRSPDAVPEGAEEDGSGRSESAD